MLRASKVSDESRCLRIPTATWPPWTNPYVVIPCSLTFFTSFRRCIILRPLVCSHTLYSLSVRSRGPRVANMATSSNSYSTADHENKSSGNDDEQGYISRVGWKTLFTFTTKQHLLVLVGGITAASVAALSMPAFAIIYGLIFGQYTSYGEGSIDSNQLMSNITRLCIILTGLTTLNWIANSFYFFFFLMFGELQARSARNRIFDALIKKDLAWFDMRETGIAGFLPTVQMWVSLSHWNSCR